MNWQARISPNRTMQGEMGQYVAELQLHMTLQARNLIPNLDAKGKLCDRATDSRIQLLQESQAELEKIASRQSV